MRTSHWKVEIKTYLEQDESLAFPSLSLSAPFPLLYVVPSCSPSPLNQWCFYYSDLFHPSLYHRSFFSLKADLQKLLPLYISPWMYLHLETLSYHEKGESLPLPEHWWACGYPEPCQMVGKSARERWGGCWVNLKIDLIKELFPLSDV